MSIRLAGRLALVTGAGSGIGREVCRVLSREGANIVAADQNIKTAQETIASLEGAEHIALHINVEDRISVKAALDVIKQFSKPPTIIVNSAGIYRKNILTEVDDNTFNDVININLKGTFLVMQTAVKAMIEGNVTKNSSIINISSLAATHRDVGLSIYSASKAGVIAMTKCASLEFGHLGIRINAVLPGFIETPMTAHISDESREMLIKQIPLQGLGQPEDVAEVIAFLASDKSSYINGASIEISGGI
ncbi:Estradiol 17-beta-dehydrogenase 8 [Camponotus floridanus]|uniref:(3R)-3-hydroxyacyl-CoA dehydrogenase n=1 Tax=Camponotus floridanus TaxID=104421 RepID=E1ZVG2_CAMFO|nr:estradiol 17-beta-dehydrogenase 8 [Camponotus floridanus]EFN74828.1 Estradiol 17-beta-dehydrogenase 8 [Camponotus floridanus]